jgi:hypothetical protein
MNGDHGVAAMAFADVLLPGDGLFPSASASGSEPLLMARLAAAEDGTLLPRLNAALGVGSFASLSAEARRAVAAGIEANEPKLFDAVRKIVFFTYYEQPAVIAAIRGLGIPYNTSPLPDGYPPASFDPAVDSPSHGRGRWTATHAVVRVDLSGLDHLKSEDT